MEISYRQLASKFPEKKKGDIRIGIICSESNPPNIIEFLRALNAMSDYLIDKIVYTVTDGIHKNCAGSP
ncbi:MAG: hypothetical protein HY755_12820 [Nitrospirae bacterium]|nr:hypothetical protein [Nitrospirota bacterium]